MGLFSQIYPLKLIKSLYVKCEESSITRLTIFGIHKYLPPSKYLGHTINSNDKESIISAGISQFWKRFNIFTADFGHIHPRLQCNIFKQYCCTFYGAPLWCFSTYERLCIAWRKALRKLWQVPSMTHGNVLALLSDSKPLDIYLMQRFVLIFFFF